ncbi:MAG: hypothetical protein GY801_25975 [bacterium]|nr:hypothetical protein [bacterium]
MTVTPVLDQDGHCTQLIGSVHDIIDLKLVEDADRWVEIPVDTLKTLPEIIHRLEGEFRSLWETVRQHDAFYEMEDFARQIKALGEQYSLNILIQFGSDLLLHVRNFDIDRIKAYLGAYPQLIEQLKLQIAD